MKMEVEHVWRPIHPVHSVRIEMTAQEAADLLAVVGNIGGSNGSLQNCYAGTVRETTERVYKELAELRGGLPPPQGVLRNYMYVSPTKVPQV